MKKIVKSYNEEGTIYQFDSKRMLMYANQLKYDHQMQGKKKNKGNIMRELAEMMYVSEDAVKSWMYGNSGPSEISQVKQIANYFGIDYHNLLNKEEEEMTNKTNMLAGMAEEAQVQYTKERVREIYGAVLDFIEAIVECNYVENPDENGDPDNPEYIKQKNEKFREAVPLREKTDRLLERAMLDIPENLYEKVHKYMWTQLENALEDATKRYFIGEEDLGRLDPYDEELADLNFQVFRGGYMAELRRIFSDFTVE